MQRTEDPTVRNQNTMWFEKKGVCTARTNAQESLQILGNQQTSKHAKPYLRYGGVRRAALVACFAVQHADDVDQEEEVSLKRRILTSPPYLLAVLCSNIWRYDVLPLPGWWQAAALPRSSRRVCGCIQTSNCIEIISFSGQVITTQTLQSADCRQYTGNALIFNRDIYHCVELLSFND